VAEDVAVGTLVGFGRALAEEGLASGTERTLTYCQAVAELGPHDGTDLYWAGRLTLVSSRTDLAAYDRVFARYFGGAPQRREAERPQVRLAALAPDARSVARGPRDPGGEIDSAPEDASELAVSTASPIEILRHKSFDHYSDEERAEAAKIIARLGARRPERVSRRSRRSRRRGRRPDLARTLRAALRTEGEPFERFWRRRRTRPRRLVLVIDVSGSMGGYVRTLARFAHSAMRAGRHVEAFVFGTRLTRVTPVLRSRDPDVALAALGDAVPDWEGGTRIGESLKELIAGWGRRGPLRGAVVVLCSDGLECGDPHEVGVQMRRLSMLAHRVIWLNPLKAGDRYEPLARGMTAALPYVDDFLSGHNLAGLESLVEALAEPGRAPGGT
jgi:uncharacterized protein